MTSEEVAMTTQLLDDAPVAERRLTLAGIPTTLLEGGDGTPLVLLHGPGGSARHWARVLPALASGSRVVAPDLPGQGALPADGVELEEDRVLAWLGELIDETCPSPPVLVGYALGGAIVARFAAARGDQLAQLVLVDALGLAPFAPTPEFGAALQAFMADPGEKTHEQLWRFCAFDLDHMRDGLDGGWEPFAADNVERARTPSVQAALGSLMERFAFPAIDDAELARIDVPTALIWGRHDLATPLGVAEAAAERHDWALQVIEDCADDPPMEQPEAFVRALRTEVLRARVGDALMQPGDDGFADATRLWNAMIDRTPAVVVQPAGTEDVVAAIGYAREHGVPVTVRGGGHNIAGAALADGGVEIDMSRLRDVQVDPEARCATVQPGCLLQDVDQATQRHGLATPLGFMSEVGVAGLTLGGGLGYLSRRFGWTVDNLLEVEIVTADGGVRRASRTENADLFWGVRGAGAHLGVITSFVIALHPVGPTVYGGLIAWPFARAGAVLRAYRDFATTARREVSAFLVLTRAPEAPFVPAEWHGERICAMIVCHSGAPEQREPALAPLRALGDPVLDGLRELPYAELQSHLDESHPKGFHSYWRTSYAAELSDELLTELADAFARCPSLHSEVGILHLGGAIGDRRPDDGAVGNRDARFACGILGMWEASDPDAARHTRWVRDAGERLLPHSTGATYANFVGADEGADRLRASYGANLDRLLELKRRFDPEGLFRALG
jgi:FAD/FMN-containing dehydrogenase/pimeloyl-ACP methyl ester carboxylesterase